MSELRPPLAATYALASQIAPSFKIESVIDTELFSKVSALQFGEFENILGNELGAQVGLFDEKTRV